MHTKGRRLLCGLVFPLVFASTSLWAEGPAIGPEFTVNTYTTELQNWPAVAMMPTGEFLVVWASVGSFGTDTFDTSVQGQRFDASGAPTGAQFQINTYTTMDQRLPDVSIDSAGNSVVVWETSAAGGTKDLLGRRLALDGSPLGSEFQLNTYISGSQSSPSVAAAPSGEFVAVWSSDGSTGSDTDGQSIQAQRYADDGTPRGSEFQVNTYTASDQFFPSVEVSSDASFVVVWQSEGSSGPDTDRSVQGQRYAADGTPLGSEFQVNSYTTGRQENVDLALLPGGGFVVSWSSYGSAGSDTSFNSIQARRFDSGGTPLGGEFQVNTYTTLQQKNPSVAYEPGGSLTIAWESNGSLGSDTEGTSIQARRYAPDGDPIGGQFQVNSLTSDFQFTPTVGLDAQERFVVVWAGESMPGQEDEDIRGQRFAPNIFEDGFESGDTSAWSNTVP